MRPHGGVGARAQPRSVHVGARGGACHSRSSEPSRCGVREAEVGDDLTGSMRICKIWDGDYPWDVRVEKVALSLTEAGHEVHLVARNTHRRPIREKLAEAQVHRLRPWWPLGRRLDAITM